MAHGCHSFGSVTPSVVFWTRLEVIDFSQEVRSLIWSSVQSRRLKLPVIVRSAQLISGERLSQQTYLEAAVWPEPNVRTLEV